MKTFFNFYLKKLLYLEYIYNMKYSLVKKLIKKDIKNIFLALSNDDFDLSETGGVIINAIEHLKILSSTLKSDIEYNYKINDILVNMWVEAEKDPEIVAMINTYGKGQILAGVLLYNRARNKTLSMLNNAKVSYECDQLMADVNVIDCLRDVSYTDITDGCTITSNSIYINSNGNVIYNIPTDISKFSFSVVGGRPTEIVTSNIDSGIVGNAILSGFTIKIEGNKIIGEVDTNNITADCGNLVQIKLDDTPEKLEFIDFKDNNSDPILVTYHDNSNKTESTEINSLNLTFKYNVDSHGNLKKTAWTNYYDTSLENKVILQTDASSFINDTNSQYYNKLILRKPEPAEDILKIDQNYIDTQTAPYTISNVTRVEIIEDITISNNSQYFYFTDTLLNIPLVIEGNNHNINITVSHGGIFGDGGVGTPLNADAICNNLEIRNINIDANSNQHTQDGGYLLRADFSKGINNGSILIDNVTIINAAWYRYGGGITGNEFFLSAKNSTALIKRCDVTGVAGSTTGTEEARQGHILGRSSGNNMDNCTITIEECTATGPLCQESGMIIGGECGRLMKDSTILIKNCSAHITSFIGTPNNESAGIAGYQCNKWANNGFIIVENCYVTSDVYNAAVGGAFAEGTNFEARRDTGSLSAVHVRNCYFKDHSVINSSISYDDGDKIAIIFRDGKTADITSGDVAQTDGTWYDANAELTIGKYPDGTANTIWVSTNNNQPWLLIVVTLVPPIVKTYIWNISNYFTDSNLPIYDDIMLYNLYSTNETNLIGTVSYSASSLQEVSFIDESNYTNVEYGGNNTDAAKPFHNTITDNNDVLYDTKKRIRVTVSSDLSSSDIGKVFELRFNNQTTSIDVYLISKVGNVHIFQSWQDLEPPLNGKLIISKDSAIFDYTITDGTNISNNTELWIKTSLQQDFIDACKSTWVKTILVNM